MHVPCHKLCKNEIKKFIDVESLRLRDFIRKRFDLAGFSPRVELTFRTDAVASYGGIDEHRQPFVKICTYEVWQSVGTRNKIEYRELGEISDDKEIGDSFANWKQHLAWTMAHELAHAIVISEMYRKRVEKFFSQEVINDIEPHGLFWQEVYRILRVDACPSTLYRIEIKDMCNFVHYRATYRNNSTRYQLYRGWTPKGRYVLENGRIYKADVLWNAKEVTKYKKVGDIIHRYTSV